MARAARSHGRPSLAWLWGRPLRPSSCVLAAAVVACAAAHGESGSKVAWLLRQPTGPVETLNPTQGQQLLGYSEGKIKSMVAEVHSEASRAQASAAQARAMADRVAMLDTENKKKLKDVQDTLTVGNLEGQKATLMAQRATEANKEVAANAAAAASAAKTLAVEEVQQMFATKYHALEQWRNTVLTDHYENAQRASDKAAVPYDKMAGVFNSRIHKYQDEARSRLTQSKQLDVQARALDTQAEERMENNDEIKGKQDQSSARAMRAEGRELAESAQSLQDSANYMNNMMAEYAAAGRQARQRAEYEANPLALPPLEIDPNFAYTPPSFAVMGPAPAPAF